MTAIAVPLYHQHNTSIGERWKLLPSYAEYMLANHRFEKTPAIVFDLDGTIRPDHPFYLSDGLFPNVKSTLSQLVSKNITLFIITARSIRRQDSTWQYLDYKNIASYFKEIYFLPEGETDRIAVKSKQREALRAEYDIIMAVGDQKQDLCHNDTGETDQVCLNILFENPFTFE